MQCKAKAKSTGKQCRRRAVTGKRVCWVHGGATPGGLASVHFKHGRYSKYLPARLASRFEEALRDGELLVLRADVALVDSRLSELLEHIETGETVSTWVSLQETYAQFVLARQKSDEHADVLIVEMGDLIERGASEQIVWREIGETIDRRKRLVESERKRLVEMNQMITSERAMILLAAVVSIIKRNVDDRKILASISAEIGKLLVVGAGAPTE